MAEYADALRPAQALGNGRRGSRGAKHGRFPKAIVDVPSSLLYFAGRSSILGEAAKAGKVSNEKESYDRAALPTTNRTPTCTRNAEAGPCPGEFRLAGVARARAPGWLPAALPRLPRRRG